MYGTRKPNAKKNKKCELPKLSRNHEQVTKLLMEFNDKREQFTVALFQRIESLGDALISNAFDMALAGNEKMMLLLLDMSINRNLFNRLEKPLECHTVEDIDNSMQFVIEKMGKGSISIEHGMNLVKTLMMKRDTINLRDVEEQVKAITDDK